MDRYNNYHKHTHVSNIFTPDVNVKIEDYAKRAIELGEKNIFSTEHGSGGDIFEAREVCDKYGLDCKFGMEGYIVPDPLEKDNRNYHIILIPKTNVARKKLNKASSHANRDGYYYKPRLFLSDLTDNFDDDELFITSACMAGLLRDEDATNQILLPLVEKFGKNVFLEVQNHNEEHQIEINKKAIPFAKEYGLDIIAANDSHYIYPEQAKERLEFLKGKGINYGEEDSFILDYPTIDVMYSRFEKQGVLTRPQIVSAINNTLAFDACENINIDRTIKMPTIYAGKTEEEKIVILKDIVNKKFNKVMEEDEVTPEERKKYAAECRKEMQVIEETSEVHTSDYFLLNDKLFDLAINKYGGVLTRTGRGCFTKDALIRTPNAMKTIDSVVVGDEVLSEDRMWHRVNKTMSYDICEDMIEFTYRCQGSSYKKYKNICTTDHKILVYKDGCRKYVCADELSVGSLLCCPKLKHEYDEEIVYDLNKYNVFGYEFDENYIYEVVPTPAKYPYSPSELGRAGITSKAFALSVVNGKIGTNGKTKKSLADMFDNIPFKTMEDYSKYCKKHGFIRRRIPRYISMDYMWNAFVGLMYADGWTQRSNGIGLAINNTTKNGFNRYVFEKISQRIGIPIYYNYAKNKNLIQMTMFSGILNAWFTTEFFKSKKGKQKTFNKDLLNQKKELLKWIYIGMMKANGSSGKEYNKVCYDTTSLSLCGTYKTLHDIVDGSSPVSLDVRLAYDDVRGYKNAESYKLRTLNGGYHRNINKLVEDDEYWYLPVTSVEIHKNMTTTVYDMEVDGCHSYTINNIVVHNSCGAFILNKILGLTQIDRLRTTLPMYGERFMSTARLLENHALPDFDANVVGQEPFVKASRELLGEDGCFPMLAYGTMGESEAFRNVCRSAGEPYDEVNEVSKDIDAYRDDKKWGAYISESQKYVGTIVSASVHPCAHLLMNCDIEEEVGVVKLGDFLCAMITSSEADSWKYLKNDYLIVSVWDIISKVFKSIGKPIMPVKRLLENIDEDTWKLFDDGITCTLNQVGEDWATALLRKYKPRSMEELAMFVGAIRPNFAPQRDDFIARKPRTTGSEALDKVLEPTGHRVIFQESLMSMFEFLGVTPAESIGLIKKISKKKIKPEDFKKLEQGLRENWKKNTGSDDGFDKMWSDMQAQMNYGFNSPHGAATALDCLYGAYLKKNYPLHYYTVVFNIYDGNQEKTSKLTKELKYFGINLKPGRFRSAKLEYSFDESTRTIYKGIGSIKYISADCADQLYSIRFMDFPTFTDLLVYLRENTTVDARQIKVLTTIGFFSEFGKNKKLLAIVDKFFDRYKKTYVAKTKEARIAELKAFEASSPDEYLPLAERIQADREYLGYVSFTQPELPKNFCYVLAADTKFTPRVTLYCIATGKSIECKADKKFYGKHKFKADDILYCKKFQKRPNWRKTESGFEQTGTYCDCLVEYDIVTSKFT